MGGNEQGFVSDPGFDEKDINEFINTGYSGADILRSTRKYSSSKGSQYMANNGTQDVGSIVNAFNEWKKKSTESKAGYEAYVKAKQNTPGRSATILTDPSKTILGMPKSIL